MIGDEVRPSVPFPQSTSHRLDDLPVIAAVDVLIATQNPADRLVFVSGAEKPPVFSRVVDREDDIFWMRRTPVISPRRQHANEQLQFLGFVDDIVDMSEVGLVWFQRIFVVKNKISIRIGFFESVFSGHDNGLDDGETFRRSIRQIKVGISPIKAMKKLPRSVTQIEKWCTVSIRQKTSISVHGKLYIFRLTRGHEGRANTQYSTDKQPRHHFPLDELALQAHSPGLFSLGWGRGPTRVLLFSGPRARPPREIAHLESIGEDRPASRNGGEGIAKTIAFLGAAVDSRHVLVPELAS